MQEKKNANSSTVKICIYLKKSSGQHFFQNMQTGIAVLTFDVFKKQKLNV